MLSAHAHYDVRSRGLLAICTLLAYPLLGCTDDTSSGGSGQGGAMAGSAGVIAGAGGEGGSAGTIAGTTAGVSAGVMAGEGGTMAAGEGGTMAAGEGGTMAAGEGGTMAAGEGGTMAAGEGGTMAAGEGGTMAAGEGGTMAAGEGGTMAGTGSTAPTFTEVYAIIQQRCGGGPSGCHAMGQSGGLNMQSQATAYANLVGANSTRCSGAVRVVAGNADQSLIVQALEGSACVDRMPLNRAALSANDLATIRGWIDAGALDN